MFFWNFKTISFWANEICWLINVARWMITGEKHVPFWGDPCFFGRFPSRLLCQAPNRLKVLRCFHPHRRRRRHRTNDRWLLGVIPAPFGLGIWPHTSHIRNGARESCDVGEFGWNWRNARKPSRLVDHHHHHHYHSLNLLLNVDPQ